MILFNENILSLFFVPTLGALEGHFESLTTFIRLNCHLLDCSIYVSVTLFDNQDSFLYVCRNLPIVKKLSHYSVSVFSLMG